MLHISGEFTCLTHFQTVGMAALSLQVAYKVFDASVTFNLRPNGNQIPVTNINKEGTIIRHV